MAEIRDTPRSLPSQEILLSLLRYEPDTGKLFWRERSVAYFKREQDWKTWNSRFSGKEAFTAFSDGYKQGAVLYYRVEAHRVIATMLFGSYLGEVDHINGDRADNRRENLRIVRRSENLKNRRMSSRNTSGHTGVRWVPHANKWSARIEADGKPIHLGYFASIEDAIAARKAAEVKYDFHINHGRQP